MQAYGDAAAVRDELSEREKVIRDLTEAVAASGALVAKMESAKAAAEAATTQGAVNAFPSLTCFFCKGQEQWTWSVAEDNL